MNEPWRSKTVHQLRRAGGQTEIGARVVSRRHIRTGVVWVVVAKRHQESVKDVFYMLFDLESTTSGAKRSNVMPGDYVEVPE